MEEKAAEERGDGSADDRETLKATLRTMSVGQLRELRSTIVRLKHLPFTKLTEVLFTESQQPSTEQANTSRVQEDSPTFAYEFRGHCESEATRTLFEDVEAILRSKEESPDH